MACFWVLILFRPAAEHVTIRLHERQTDLKSATLIVFATVATLAAVVECSVLATSSFIGYSLSGTLSMLV